MNIEELVDKYIDQIIIEDTDYVSVGYSDSDAACILLNIPIAMLEEYAVLKKLNKEKLPDGAEFWKETRLEERLKSFRYRGHEPLADVLSWLTGNVLCEYSELNDPGRIRLRITEGP